MSREHDTVPDLLPSTEPDTTVDNTGQSDDKPSKARQAEIDEMLEFLANRRPPIRYREGADSNGQDGARYFTQHEPAKRVDLDTDPGSNVIVRDSIREKTPPMGAATTQPLIAPSIAAGPNGTDPMWPPVTATSNQASVPSEEGRITPLPEPTWGQISRARRAHEKTMLVAEPAPRRRLAPWHVGLLVAAVAFAVGVLALILLYATKNVGPSDERRASDVPSSAKPSASSATSTARSEPSTVLSAPAAATSTQTAPTPTVTAPTPTVTPPARSSSTAAASPRPPGTASAPGTQHAVPRPVAPSNGAVPDQEKEN